VFYSALLVADVYLLVKYIKLGPEETLGHSVGE
jgi:cytochrome bd ubiquinol oxidase subunit I